MPTDRPPLRPSQHQEAHKRKSCLPHPSARWKSCLRSMKNTEKKIVAFAAHATAANVAATVHKADTWASAVTHGATVIMSCCICDMCCMSLKCQCTLPVLMGSRWFSQQKYPSRWFSQGTTGYKYAHTPSKNAPRGKMLLPNTQKMKKNGLSGPLRAALGPNKCIWVKDRQVLMNGIL
ncbi:hypothetical protein COCSUDRAFT_32068 [Coccomyxa subellipsoidea C-169]|uniref:Uncharacterized protein n=1 Tax=Coccomyxa subellipsoidea (strain C-169) TaxID=574566 RepID=I0ZAI1_COCSC|nr:hypothetical protein COCSUDRAFT_32068 [Coccomyxa subellipsoidea C-169]EIE27650.1 hypothetical protein COCSUDRAFT_32068 [Coccomyxa subellipsoidea C-169]|eukprot:XP_005652194.1 hypothetical protein COCSUDRAFT_32068 [Coccomyxa subellipsoidea C-169]